MSNWSSQNYTVEATLTLTINGYEASSCLKRKSIKPPGEQTNFHEIL